MPGGRGAGCHEPPTVARDYERLVEAQHDLGVTLAEVGLARPVDRRLLAVEETGLRGQHPAEQAEHRRPRSCISDPGDDLRIAPGHPLLVERHGGGTITTSVFWTSRTDR